MESSRSVNYLRMQENFTWKSSSCSDAFLAVWRKLEAWAYSLKFKLMQSILVFAQNPFMLREILFPFITGSNYLEDLFSKISKDTFAQQEWHIWIGPGLRSILLVENQMEKFVYKTSYLNFIVMIMSWHKTSFTWSFEN